MSKKLYCYADESGQDLKSKIFIVGVLTIKDKEAGQEWANRLESCKKSLKWNKTKYKNKIIFLENLAQTDFTFYIHTRVFTKKSPTQDYSKLFFLGLKEILQEEKFKNYKINLVIDGKIKKNILLKTGSYLRQNGIAINKVKNGDDHKISLIRIIDGVVGAVRDCQEKRNEEVMEATQKLITCNRIIVLK